MPDCHKNYRANQCSYNGNTVDIDIPESSNDNDLSHQPDPYKGRDNSADESEWESPSNDKFRYKAHNGCNNEVNDKVETKCPDVVSNVNRNAIRQDM